MHSNYILVPLVGFMGLARCLERQIPLSGNSQVHIPSLGFGTWNIDKSNASEVVSTAIQTGYRHIDCAAAYGNQKEVGRGIADGLKKAGIERYDIWVTSKLWNDHHKPDQVEIALEETLSELDLGYVDLYLMHWPVASTDHGNVIDYVDTWHALGDIPRHKARNIGISNFSPDQVHRLSRESEIKPAVHQFELHPYLQQVEWVNWHKEHDIKVTAYSPLGGTNPTYGPDGSKDPPWLLENPTILQVAEKRGCTSAQVALAWGIGRGTSVIPKSSRVDHMTEDFDALKCELQEEDFHTIAAISRHYVKRYNNPSDDWGVNLYDGLEGLEGLSV